MSISIRPATLGDVPLILQLIRDLAEYERAPEAAVATPELIKRHLFGEKRAAECLIAELDGAPEGFAVFFHNFSTWLGRPGLYLEDLFVRPRARGRGLGKALLVRLAQIAQERECGRMEWAVLDWNTPTIEFYKSLGAKPMDEWTVYRIEGDAIGLLAESR